MPLLSSEDSAPLSLGRAWELLRASLKKFSLKKVSRFPFFNFFALCTLFEHLNLPPFADVSCDKRFRMPNKRDGEEKKFFSFHPSSSTFLRALHIIASAGKRACECFLPSPYKSRERRTERKSSQSLCLLLQQQQSSCVSCFIFY